MTIIAVFVFATLATVVVSYFVIRLSVNDRAGRILLFIVAALTPAMLFVALIRTFIRRSEPIPCPEELAAVERDIDNERVQRFGGRPLKPAFSERWQAAYLTSLKRTAGKVDSVLNIFPQSDHVLSMRS